MLQLAIIPCGRKKVWDKYPEQKATKVDQAYIGILHRLTKQYAELFCDNWVVLSAKHGFQLRDEIIPENYNLTFGMKGIHPIIGLEQLINQINKKKLSEFDQIVALTGKKHKAIIDQIFPEEKLIYPLLGTKGIGEMQQRLKQSIEMKAPLH